MAVKTEGEHRFHGCIIATFITKTWLSTVMWDKFIYVLLALSLRVLIQKYLHVAGLGLVDLASASEFWPRPWHLRFGLFNITA